MTRNILLLRLGLLLLSAVILTICSVFNLLQFEWQQILIVLIMTTSWSLFLLINQNWLSGSIHQFRELVVDIIWVTAVVYITGGTSNPFIYYFLVLTAIAALTVQPTMAWAISILGTGLYTAILILDSQQHFEHFSSDYRIHLIGMWLNFVVSNLIICFFVIKLMTTLRKQQTELTKAREENLKNEQLIGLATVAASTVHNLATPISTLKILADDMIEQQSIPKQLRDDAQMMQEQIDRCFSTMKNLSSLAQNSENLHDTPVNNILDFLKEHYSLLLGKFKPEFLDRCATRKVIYTNDLLQYALINLINNAIESASQSPKVIFQSTDNHLLIRISNRSMLSENQITERWGKPKSSTKEAGLGIGSFLANSTIEKQGGFVKMEVKSVQPNSADNNEKVIIVEVNFPLNH